MQMACTQGYQKRRDEESDVGGLRVDVEGWVLVWLGGDVYAGSVCDDGRRRGGEVIGSKEVDEGGVRKGCEPRKETLFEQNKKVSSKAL